MANLQIFELSEVADLLQLPISTVKNWTIGRPLSIKPSLRASQGKGSRNLYSREDLLVLALAAQLNRDGFTPSTLQKVLRELKGRSDLLGSHYSALALSSPDGGLVVKFLTSELTIHMHERVYPHAIGRYILDIKKLVNWVEARMQESANGSDRRRK
jgi:hypothetical protein